MNEKRNKHISKFLSLVLRHQPELIDIELDQNGWVEVTALLNAFSNYSNAPDVTLGQLQRVVDTNNKQRFEFDESGNRIRARQGHSVDIDHGLEPTTPPEFLLHGTPTRFIEQIRETGLKKMNRHHVHLHEDIDVATDVGTRRGKAIILRIRSREMHQQGHEFFVTANNVWLTDHVPPAFIEFPEG